MSVLPRAVPVGRGCEAAPGRAITPAGGCGGKDQVSRAGTRHPALRGEGGPPDGDRLHGPRDPRHGRHEAMGRPQAGTPHPHRLPDQPDRRGDHRGEEPAPRTSEAGRGRAREAQKDVPSACGGPGVRKGARLPGRAPGATSPGSPGETACPGARWRSFGREGDWTRIRSPERGICRYLGVVRVRGAEVTASENFAGNGEKLRVMVVDDHALFRRGLEMVLAQEPDIDLVGEASDGAEAVDRATELMPDVVLMDVRMPRR